MTPKLYVHNIKCGGCAASIRAKLELISDVKDIEVNVDEGSVSFNTSKEDNIEEVKKALAKMGYPEGDPNIVDTAKSYVSCMIGKMK